MLQLRASFFWIKLRVCEQIKKSLKHLLHLVKPLKVKVSLHSGHKNLRVNEFCRIYFSLLVVKWVILSLICENFDYNLWLEPNFSRFY